MVSNLGLTLLLEMKKKLAIVTTHPIQYYAPLFRELAESEVIDLKVFYTKGKVTETQFEPDFGKIITWDIPLLEGYVYQYTKNKSNKKNGFWSIENPNLIAEIETWQAECVLVFGWSYLSHFKILNYFKGKIPVYFRGDSNLLDEKRGLKTFLRRYFLHWVYSKIDLAFYVGIENKKYYLKHGLKENQLAFAPHAIENNRFYDTSGSLKQKAEEWRTHLGIKDNDKAILFVGKFIVKKNPMLLLNSFKHLNVNNIHLIFVGNGILENELKSSSKTISNVHFIPFQNQSQMPVIYRLGDVFCLPSSGPGETWGLASNEAMACGKPIIVSDKCGCAADLVKEGENGYIFESGNEKQLTELLDKMLAFNLKLMGQASQNIINQYSIKEIVNAVELTFQKSF